jgi:hypothetical protein
MTTTYRDLFINASAGLCFAIPNIVFAAPPAKGAEKGQEAFVRSSAPTEVFKRLAEPGTKVDDSSVSPLPVSYAPAPTFELSEAAKLAIGAQGLQRLDRFRTLRANWDREGARPLNMSSVIAFSQFFRDSGLRPMGLAVFMTRDGNVAVNWVDEQDLVTELEFQPDGVHYFFELTGDEGVRSQYEMANLLRPVMAVAA